MYVRIFSSRIFLVKIQNLEMKLHTQWEAIACLLKNDKYMFQIFCL